MKQRILGLQILLVCAFVITGGQNASAAPQSHQLKRDYTKQPINFHIALPAVATDENRNAGGVANRASQSGFAESQSKEIRSGSGRSAPEVEKQYAEKRSVPEGAKAGGAQDQPPQGGGGPLQIGFGREMPAAYRGDLASRLTWDKQADGSVVSALSLSSPEAQALRIALRTNWPAGTTLRFFNPADTKQQLPPLKRRDFTTDNSDEPLWSPLVEGDTLGLEISLPSAAAAANLALAIDRVSHLTLSPLRAEPTYGLFGRRADSCQIDVACRTTTPTNLPSATGRLVFTTLFGLTNACSGTLLRDTLSSDPCPGNYRGNCRIYLLTARHCIFQDDEVSSLTTFWDYERSSCGGSVPDRFQAYGIGAELLATRNDTDSTLLRLRYKPPVPTAAYAKWFAKPLSYPTDVIAIHHPQSDLKKWSSGRATRNVSNVLPFFPFDLRVPHSLQVEWNEGMNEPGSSGSGLFDLTGRLVGVSSASPVDQQCSDAFRTSDYGRFDRFYPHVRSWLNPVGPAVRSVAFSSTPVSGDTYQLSEVIEVTVEFERAVTVTGTPQLNLTVGRQTRQAVYVAGSGGTRLRFEYAVQATDRDLHGVSISANNLNGGSIKDNLDDLTDAGLRHNQVAIDSSRKVDGRLATAPAVRQVAFTGAPSSGDTYRFNEAIAATVEFDRAVTVTGMPRLALTIGSQIRQASYASLIGLRTLSFDYIVQDTDHDTDGISIAADALAFNQGTIKLAGGTADAVLTHSSIAADSARKVDGDIVPIFVDVTVPAQAYIVNVPIVSLTLPRASNGTPPLSYALSPLTGLSLSRLSFDSSTRTLSGTPTMPMAETVYTWTAMDADGDAAALHFNITVAADDMPTFGTVTVAPQSFAQGRPVVDFGLPEATGGNPPLSYALGLPAGLSFNPNSRSINGTPTMATGLNAYTLTVTDADGDTDTLDLSLVVPTNQLPSFDLATLSVPLYPVNQMIAPLSLPLAAGGDGDLTYALRPPTLPIGLTFNPGLRRIEGMPTEATAKTNYAWTATDANGDVAARRFTIEVARGVCNRTPWVRDSIVAAIDGVTNCADVTSAHLSAITVLQVNALHDDDPGPNNGDYAGLSNLRTLWSPNNIGRIAKGLFDPLTNLNNLQLNNSEIVYLEAGVFDRLSNLTTLSLGASENLVQLDRGLFDRLSNLTTLDITGTRLTRLDAGIFDRLSNLQSLDLSNNLFVYVNPRVFRRLTQLRTLALGGALSNLTSIESDLFAGLSNLRALYLGDLSLSLSELPSGIFDGLNLTDKLYLDRGDDGQLIVFTLRVYPEPVGSQVRARIDEAAPRELRVSWTATGRSSATGTAIIPAGQRTSAPFGLAGSQAITYTLSNPSLPGVTEPTDDNTGNYTGFRLAASTAPVTLPIQLSFGTATVPPQSYTQGRAITALSLPMATGGVAPLSYALSTPTGLSFEGATLRLAGTPTMAMATTTYTLTVTDARDNTDTLDFTVTVAGNRVPSFGEATIAPQSYAREQTITALSLPLATGGDGTLSYVLLPTELPTGLSFTRNILSGRPTIARPLTGYRWVATDADGDATTLLFTIAVVVDRAPSFGRQEVAPQRYIAGHTITPLTLPRASGGNSTLTYTLSPPAGLSFNSMTLVLSGRPEAAQALTHYTLTAADIHGDIATLPFAIAVETDTGLHFGGATVTTQNYVFRQTITPLTLPQATGGNGDLTYTLRPNLPFGLSFDTDTRSIAGTPAVIIDPLTYTWLATDADGDTATLRFLLGVDAGVCNRTRQVREAIIAALPRVTSCVGITTTDLAGITELNMRSQKIGTLKTEDFFGLDGLIDLDLSLNLLSNLEPELFQELPNLRELNLRGNQLANLDPRLFNGLRNLRILDLAANQLTQLDEKLFAGLHNLRLLELGANALSRLSPNLFAGLTNLRTLSLGVNQLTRLELGLFNGLHNLESLTLVDNQLIDLPPKLFAGLSSLQTLILTGNLLSRLDADLLNGVSNLKQLALSSNQLSQLPVGLFDGLNLTRLPGGTEPGFRRQGLLELHRNPGHPFMLNVYPERIGHRVRARIDEAAPREVQVTWTATGGSSETGTAIIPAGLRLSQPFGEAGLQDVTITLSNPTLPGISESTSDTEGQYTGFALVVPANPRDRVTLPAQVSFNGATVADQSYAANATITPLTLPQASGGNGTLSYALAPLNRLPNGLSFSTARRAIEGRPSIATAKRTYTWTATDPNGASAALSFTLSVGICGRTWQVREAIINQTTGVTDCAGITSVHLGAISNLSLFYQGITTLKSDDFAGLNNLRTLNLASNQLIELPPDLFAGLTSLESLFMGGNGFTMLAPELFAGLTNLTTLSLSNNRLATLSPTLFAALTNLTGLHLGRNSLSQLPPGLFDGLNLTRDLLLSRQTGASRNFVLSIYPERVGSQVRARIDQAAPRQIQVTWSVTDDLGTTGTTVIPAGARVSAPFGPTTPRSNDVTITLSNPTLPGVSESTSDGIGNYTGFSVAVPTTPEDRVTIPGTEQSPAFSETVPPQRYAQGQMILSLSLPQASGGTSPLNYVLSPLPPSGLSYTEPSSDALHGGVLSGTPNVAAPMTTYALRATDAENDIAALYFTMVVDGRPTASAGQDQIVSEGAWVTLDGSSSFDPERQPLRYTWTPPQDITLSDPTIARPTFITPEQLTDPALTFSLIVNDGNLDSTPNTVLVTVRTDSDAPTAWAGPDQIVARGATVVLDGSGSFDPEGETLSYAWTQFGGTPTVTLDDPTVARPTFAAPRGLTTNSMLTFALTVTDAGGKTSSADTVIVTIIAAGVTVEPTTGLRTTEAGGETSFTVVLDTEPTAAVTIGITSLAPSEGRATPPVLTFNAAEWNTAQTVTITGVDDNDNDGHLSYSIQLAAAMSGDNDYHGFDPDDVAVINADNEAGLALSQTAGLTTTEENSGQDTFTVALTTRPTVPITVNLRSEDPGEGTVMPVTLTFATSGWNLAQTVTVTGQNDNTDDDDQNYVVILTTPVSTDPDYSGLSYRVSVTNTDNDTAGLTIFPLGLGITEGASDIYTVALVTEPTASVTVSITTTADSSPEVGISPPVLTFTSNDWRMLQTVTVHASADGDSINDSALVTHRVSDYGTVTTAAAVTVTVNDNDAAGVTVNPMASLTTTEAGAQDTFTVVLAAQPTAAVTINLTSSNNAEGTVVPTALTFATNLWNMAQTVTITGQDDDVDDGDTGYTIHLGQVASSDGDYNIIDPADVSVTNRDNDTAGVRIRPANLVTTEDGSVASFTAVLTSKPMDSVRTNLVLIPPGPNEGTVSPTSLIFGVDDWNRPQRVTVRGLSDSLRDGDRNYPIHLSVLTSNDSEYHGILPTARVSVTNRDSSPIFCRRTRAVRDAIVTATAGISDCAAITADHLSAITDLNLHEQDLTTLQTGDFAGLTGMRTLRLSSNFLRSLPDDVFAGLTALRTLRLDSNQLRSLPDGVFTGLTALRTLRLNSNQLRSLPDGVFAGLTVLDNRLWVHGNSVSPLPLTVSLVPTLSGQVKATINTGAPFALTLPLVATNGTIADADGNSISSITIARGNTESSAFTVSHTAGATTIDLGTLPALPTGTVSSGERKHRGYSLIKSAALPLGLGVVINPTRLSLNEGAAATYTVMLATRPAGSVSITISNDSTDELRVISALTFSRDNWNQAQTVTVNALQDDDQTHDTAILSHGLSGLGGTAESVTVTITDNDAGGICSRSRPVREAIIVATSGITDCPDITANHLRALTRLDLSGQNIKALQAGDFAGLLRVTELRLHDNQLRFLPDGIFDDLTGLIELHLHDNQLRALPDDGFDRLTSLRTLDLSNNQLRALTGDIFRRLTGLTRLDLDGNQLRALPDGVFAGLGVLDILQLQSNPGSPFPLTISSAPAGTGQIKIIVDTGAPFALAWAVPSFISISNAIITASGGESISGISIPAGSTESAPFALLRINPADAVAVFFLREPALPTGTFGNDNRRKHQGYTLRYSASDRTFNFYQQRVAIEPTHLNLTEGASGTYTVALGTRPTGNVMITVASDNHAVSVTSALTFTPNNWDTAQMVTVSTVRDNNILSDRAIFSHGVSGYGLVTTAASVTVTVTDTDNAGICHRTAAVRDAIVALTPGISSCADITADHLPMISGTLRLSNANLSTLQAGDFSGLTGITTLRLGGNQLNSLPAGVFTGLTGLTTLRLNNNRLRSLPAGVFAGLGVLDNLWLHGNPVEPLPLTVSLVSAGAGQVKATVPVGAPFALTLPLRATNGTIADEGSNPISSIAIATGATESAAFTVSRSIGVTGATTANLGTLPALPTGNKHRGYILTKSSALPLSVFAPGVTTNPTTDLTTTEAGGTATFTVALDIEPTHPVTISLMSSDTGEGTVPAALTFATTAWATAQTVTVTGVDDAVDDGDVGYTIWLNPAASSDNNYNNLDPADVSVTNEDDDTAGVTVGDISGATTEAGGTATFTVVLDSEPTHPVTISLMSSDTGEGTVPAALTFATTAWATAQTVTVTGVDDAVDDGNQSYTIELDPATSSDSDYHGLDPADVSVTNEDDDTAGFMVSAISGVTTEGGGTATFTVALDTEPTAVVTISLSSSNTGEGMVSPNALTFATDAWNTAQTVTVIGVGDDIDDGDVGYTIRLNPAASSDSNYNNLDPADVFVTSEDDDTAGVVVDTDSVMEGAQSTGLTTGEGGTADTFTVALDTEPTAVVTISLSSSNTGEGVVSPSALTFATDAWNTAQTVTVTGVDDAVDDGNQSYTIELNSATSSDSNYHGLDPADVSVTNEDNDTAGFMVGAISGVTTESGGTATFTVVLDSEPTHPVTVGLSSGDEGEGTVMPAALTFATTAWATAQTVTVTGVDDAVDDGDVGYTIRLNPATSSDSNYHGLDPADVSVTNEDDDTAGITVGDISGATTETGGAATFTVVLDSEPTAVVTIGLTSSDSGEGTVSPGSLTFATDVWNTAQTVTVTGVNDAVDDGNQSYTIELDPATSSDSNYNNLDPVDVSVVNEDDDMAGVTVGDISGGTTEAGGKATFTVVLNSEPTAAVTIGLTSSDIGEGMVSPSALTFATDAWNTAQTVTVTGVNDAVDDDNQSYTVELNSATSSDSNYNNLDPADVSVTNEDDDTAGFMVGAISGVTTESGGTATFMVVLDSEPTHPVTVGLSSGDEGEGTVMPAALTFATTAWNTAQTVMVTGVNDDIDDGNQSYMITLDLSSTDAKYNVLDSINVDVINNDDTDTAGVTVGDISGATTEVGGAATFTVALDTEPTAVVTISLSSSNTGEGVVSPNALTFATDAWNTAQTVTVTGVDDDINDGNQTYMITLDLSSTDAKYNVLDSINVDVINNDDTDTAGVTVGGISGATTETGGVATFTVMLDSEPTAAVTIGLTSSDIGEGTVSPGSLTFATDAWNTAQTVTVIGVDDAVDDGNQSYTIGLDPAASSDSNYNNLDPADVSVTNEDDDTAGVTVGDISGATTEVGGVATFTVALDTEPTAVVTISLSSSNTGEGVVSPSALTFATDAWNTAQTVTVTGVNDAVDDGNQSYTIELDPATSSDSNYHDLDPADVSVTNEDDDTAGVKIVPTDLGVTEGASGTYTVVLMSRPTAAVTVSTMIADGSSSDISIDPTLLVFNTNSWNMMQTVTVSAASDASIDNETATLNHSVTGYGLVTTAAEVTVRITDNDRAGITVGPRASLSTTEAGGVAKFTVELVTEPTAVVTISLSSSNTGEGVASPSALTFATDAWDTAQTVTVTGVDDAVDDGNQSYTIELNSATSSDSDYHGLDPADVSVTNEDNDTAGFMVGAISGVTTEGGGTATFTVVLDSEPTHPVTVGLSSGDEGEGTVMPAALTFATTAWNMEQTVTVTGVDDAIDDGNQSYTIELNSATSSDSDYHGLDPADVSVTNEDDDTAGFMVGAISGVTTEGDGTATFTVVLDSEPTHPVTVGLSSGDEGEGTVMPAALTFATTAWNMEQTVTVTGVDDAVADGNQSYTIELNSATSSDSNYNNLDPADVSVTNEDDDTAGFMVGAISGVTTESGGTATFTVVLDSEPTHPVTVGLSSSNTGEGMVSPGSLTFATTAWNMEQTVTVTGVDDDVADGNQSYTIELDPATSSDSNYNNLDPADVSVTNEDDDTAGFMVGAISGVTTEGDGTATFTVVLDSEPTHPVTVGLSSGDEGEGTVMPAALTFATTAWDMEQTVTVTGVDDAVADGNQSYTIELDPATSSDSNYNNLDPADVSVTNEDNDTAGFMVGAISGVTTESGGTATFTVVLDSEPTHPVTVGLSSSNTGEGMVSPGSLTFATAAWNTEQTVTVTGVDDDVADGNQSYTIELDPATSSDSNYNNLDPADVSVTNEDDDTAGFMVGAISGVTTESGGTATFTVVLDSEPTHPVTVGLSSSNTGEGVVSPSALTFATTAWNTAQTVTVTGVDDAVADGNQSYTIELDPATSSDSDYHGLDPADVSVTNEDDDTAGVTVGDISGVTTEAGRAATFTVALDTEPTAVVTISLSSSNTGEGMVSPGSLTFATDAWNTAQTVTVTGVDDAVDDGNQSYTIELDPATSSDSNYHGLDPADVSVVNEDDDTAGFMVGAISGVTTEGGGTATFTVVLDSEPTRPVTVGLSSGDEGEGTVMPAALTFATTAWNMEQTVTVTGVNDAVDDGNQSYTVELNSATSSDTNYNGLDPADVSVVNEDDDTAGVTVGDISGATTEAGGAATFTVVLDSEPTAAVTIGLTSSDSGEGTVSPGSLTFATDAWDTAQTVTVTGVDDDIDDDDQIYTVRLAVPISDDPNYQALGLVGVSVTNENDDINPPGIVVSPRENLQTIEGGGQATFTVALTSRPMAAVTIGLSSSNRAEGRVLPVALTFAMDTWDTAQTVTVTGQDDNLHDGNIDYTVTLTAASDDSGYSALEPTSVPVANLDNEVTPTVTLALSADSIAEARGTVTVTAASNQASSVLTSVIVSAEPVAPAVASDFRLSPNTALAILAGQTGSTGTVTIAAVDNEVDAPDKMVTVSAMATNSRGVTQPVAVTLSIVDDDTAGFMVGAISGVTTEGGGTATFTVVLDSEPTHPVTVGLSSGDEGEGTVMPAALTFATTAWDMEQTVTVTGVDDAVADGNQSYTIELDPATSSDSNYNNLDPADVSVTNEDNDTAGFMVGAISGVTTEGGGTATFTVVLDSEPTHPVTVGLSSGDGGEGTVMPAALTFATTAWNMEQTVTVTGVDDDVDDGNQSYTIELDPATSSDSNYNNLDPADVSVTNEDNDTAGFMVGAISGVTTEGGGTATFTVVLDSEPTHPVTVGLSSGDGGEGTVMPAALTFATTAWNMEQTVTVTGVDDDVDDGNQSYTIELDPATSSDSNYNNLDPADVSVTNEDDDPALTVTLILTPDSISENDGTTSVTAVLNRASSETTRVTVAAAPVAPAVAGDFRLSANTVLTIAAGQTTSTGMVTIEAVDNDEVELDKTVIVSAMATNGVTLPSEVRLSITDDEVFLAASLANVNGDRTLDSDDALVMYYVYVLGNRSLNLLDGLIEGVRPEDAMRSAIEWKNTGVQVGGDLNDDGEIDGNDALIMYYAYEFKELLGDGRSGSGSQHLRALLLGSLLNRGAGSDTDYRAMLRKAHRLRRE